MLLCAYVPGRLLTFGRERWCCLSEHPKFNRAKVRRLRIAKHLTQQELAFAAELSVTQVNRIETSKTACPQMRSVKKLAAALCVEPAELLGGEGKV